MTVIRDSNACCELLCTGYINMNEQIDKQISE